jgi:hypothetical protein
MIGRRPLLLAVLLCVTAAFPVSAQIQSSDQRKCLATMNDAAVAVARAQMAVATKCLGDAAKGKLPAGQTAEQCIAADAKGKVAKAAATTAAKNGKQCAAVPDFGYTGVIAVNAAGIAGANGLFDDLFGADLDAAIIDAGANSAGAKCQAAIVKAVSKVVVAMTAEFRACKKKGLADQTIVDVGGIDACLDPIGTDAKGKVAKLLVKLPEKLAKPCAGAPPAISVPGDCAGASDLAACLATVARCRTCGTFAAADDLARDCDVYDDASDDGSCPSPTDCVDGDGDGYGQNCASGPDCDDGNPNVHPGATELCNNVDDDCNATIDEFPVDVGQECGVSGAAPCAYGSTQCVGGILMCFGNVDPTTETCNGIDDDCDGAVDATGASPPADSVGSCNARPAPPPGATSPCTSGVKTCVGGVVRCQGGTGPSAPLDGCNVDANCDGTLTNQPDTQTDVANCGACGHSCLVGAVHANVACVAGQCQLTGCQPGWHDLDANGTCEYPCSFQSAQEACNGVDDNCNGLVDEGVVAPSVTAVCGVSPNATAPECTTNVSVSCVGGAWQCTFPAGVCNAGGGCAGTAEICDALDNDCDGQLNENVTGFGTPCEAGSGLCRATGTIVCNGANATQCSAVPTPCASLPGGCTEVCDGLDNDCDGLVDESFTNKGSNAAFFVQPTVTRIGTNLWIHTYEASRPTATATVPGTGNGYFTSAPSGVTLDKTPACSAAGKMPWFNVSGLEADQVCAAAGGFVCSPTQWQTAARAKTASCVWGYSPSGVACTSAALPNPPNVPGKFCNLALTYDFNSSAAGRQEGLLPTASVLLSQCAADWSATLGNVAASASVRDITGNLREITKQATNQYRLLGGSYPTESEDSARYDFTSYLVDQNFKLYDTGFRCCFSQDPTQ